LRDFLGKRRKADSNRRSRSEQWLNAHFRLKRIDDESSLVERRVKTSPYNHFARLNTTNSSVQMLAVTAIITG